MARRYLEGMVAMLVALGSILGVTISVSAAQELGDTGIYAADPSVIRTPDGYVAVESRRGQTLVVRVAPTLDQLWAEKAVRIWFDRERIGEIWAPEIVYRDGLYHVYFTGGVGAAHRMYVISSSAPDKDYGAAVSVDLPDDKWAIDGLPFDFGDKHYFVWSGWQGEKDGQQDLFIVQLDETGAPLSDRVRIASPTETWENAARETPAINEGPQPVLDPDGQFHIVYSANGSWGANYCLADLRLAAGGDPLEPNDWLKSDGCLLGANEKTLAPYGTLATSAKGVGHHSFLLESGDPAGVGDVDTPQPFLYHGVPTEDTPSNFWAARKWFVGTYSWVPDVPYRAAGKSDTGWSPRFFE